MAFDPNSSILSSRGGGNLLKVPQNNEDLSHNSSMMSIDVLNTSHQVTQSEI